MKYYLIGGNVDTQTGGNDMDVTRLTEDEQIALAIQMSISQAESMRMKMILFLLLFRF
jgi:hypothetical protein